MKLNIKQINASVTVKLLGQHTQTMPEQDSTESNSFLYYISVSQNCVGQRTEHWFNVHMIGRNMWNPSLLWFVSPQKELVQSVSRIYLISCWLLCSISACLSVMSLFTQQVVAHYSITMCNRLPFPPYTHWICTVSHSVDPYERSLASPSHVTSIYSILLVNCSKIQ